MRNMKFKRVIALVTTIVVVCSMLTGCIGMDGTVRFNADGSGTITLKAGLSESAMEIISSMGESIAEKDDQQEFIYNGVKYIGSVVSMNFRYPEEFNSFMLENTEQEDIGVGVGLFHLLKKSDGTLNLTLTVDETTGDTSAVESQMTAEDVGLTKEITDALMADMALVFTFEFPGNVKQIVGETTGITVDGNKITIDILGLGEALNGRSDVLTFTNDVSIDGFGFSDVDAKHWFFTSVKAMFDGGLVHGIGNNLFAPQSTLTYAQFCQILASAQGLVTGEQNGYWAYKAIEACRDKGYIIDLGSYTSANYDVPMPREAAVAGMFRAKVTELLTAGLVGTSITAADIPDFEKIDDNYRNDILDAYNSGITYGMDSLRTFNPKGILTRAEICQLFYNLNWTVPVK